MKSSATTLRRVISLVCTAGLLTMLLLPAGAGQATTPLDRIGDARRVVFLGDSITYAGQYVEAVETYFITRFPYREIEFINLGLSSETVSGESEPGHAGGRYPRPHLHQRLDAILEKTRPDLIIACYGMNDGIYHPLDDVRMKSFQDGIRRLRSRAAEAGVKVIHVTPPVFDPTVIPAKITVEPPFSFARPHPDYDGVLSAFSGWLMEQRTSGWEVVDLHGSMRKWITEERSRDASFVFAPDGVHPNAAGHWFIARTILLHLGADDVASMRSPDDLLKTFVRSDELERLIRDRQHTLRDAWLMEIGHTRPGVREGLPVAEAQAKAKELNVRIRDLAGRKFETLAPNPSPGSSAP